MFSALPILEAVLRLVLIPLLHVTMIIVSLLVSRLLILLSLLSRFLVIGNVQLLSSIGRGIASLGLRSVLCLTLVEGYWRLQCLRSWWRIGPYCARDCRIYARF